MKKHLASVAVFLPLALAACGESKAPEPKPATKTAAATEPAATGPATEALNAAIAPRDPFDRARELGRVLPTLGEAGIPRVKELLSKFPLYLGSVEFELLLTYWALQEPVEAAAWAWEFGPPMYKTNAVRTTIEILTRVDPHKGSLATELPLISGGETGRVAHIAMIRGWFANDRESAIDFIMQMSPGQPRQRALYAFALALAESDGVDALMEWAESVPSDDPRLKRAVLQQVISALVYSDPESAVSFCDRHCDGEFGKGMREVLVRNRIRRGDDGAEVLEWVQQTAAENDRKDHTLWVAYASWSRRDPDTALAWMEEQMAGDTPAWVKTLYGDYARRIATDDPARAMAVAEQVEDDGDRNETMVKIARYWLTQDRAAAQAWIDSSPLTDQQREFIRTWEGPIYLPGLNQNR